MILFDRVSFSYGSREILRDMSFSIRAEERVAFLGGSGEGKTTILKLIMGLIRPDAGRILIDDEDITDKSEGQLRDVRMKFSIVFQEGALFDSLDVKENVAFCLREYSKMSEEEIDRRVRELLGKVGVEQALNYMPEELSGGMHRRVAIARSLAATEPKMFLYDEPTSGLDPVNAANICKLILDLSKSGTGFIVVTHKVFDAVKVANRFMFLYNGRMLLDGSREDILHSKLPEIQLFISELHYKEEGKNV
ncbi:MAG TPA: ATP-binding cassette domain-containing protein [Thermodesulfovibrionales bacterium]|nr:ATP-binding cassette domain-containing protein [Thermodesulfovibrionales bacterium]